MASSGGNFASGFILGRLFGGGDNDSPVVSVATVGLGVLLVGGLIFGTVNGIVNDNKTKEIKSSFDDTIMETIKDDNISSLNTTCFDWNNANNKYYFTFTGEGKDVNDNKIDYFIANYDVSDQNYYKTIDFIKSNKIEKFDKNRELLDILTNIVKTSKLVNYDVKYSVPILNDENNSKLIKSVSEVTHENGTTSYNVVYATVEKKYDGEYKVMLNKAKLKFETTEEMKKDPKYLFSKGNEQKPTIEIKKSVNIPVKVFGYEYSGGLSL